MRIADFALAMCLASFLFSLGTEPVLQSLFVLNHLVHKFARYLADGPPFGKAKPQNVCRFHQKISQTSGALIRMNQMVHMGLERLPVLMSNELRLIFKPNSPLCRKSG